MKYCQQCGAERTQDQKFCGSCGAKFIEPIQQQAEEVKPAIQEKEPYSAPFQADGVRENEGEQSNEQAESYPRYVKAETDPAGEEDLTQGQTAADGEPVAETVEVVASPEPVVPVQPQQVSAEPAVTTQPMLQAAAQQSGEPKPAEMQPAQFTVHKKRKLPKKIWIPAFIVLLIAALGVTGWILGSKYSSAEYAVDRLEKAVDEEDTKELLELLVSEDKQWKLDEEQAESFIQALQGHGDFREELYEQLRNAADSGSSGGKKLKVFESMGGSSSDSSFLKLKKDGKQWLFFDRYVFEVQPFYMELSTNLEDTVIFINGKEVATADEMDYEEQFGPYMPGIYEVTAQLETEYGPIETKQEVELFSDGVQQVDLFLNADYVSIYSNEYDAVLWVGEEEVGTIPSDGLTIGPLAVDGSVTVKAIKDYDWGTVESEEIAIEDAGDVYLELSPFNEEVEEQIYQAINDYTVSWIQAYTQLDANLLLNVTEEQRQFHKDDMDAILNQGLMMTGTAQYATYDADSFSYYADEWDSELMYVSVDMSAEYMMSVYYQGEEPIMEPYEYPLRVYLIYDSAASDWLITGLEDLYDFYPYEPVEYELSGI